MKHLLAKLILEKLPGLFKKSKPVVQTPKKKARKTSKKAK